VLATVFGAAFGIFLAIDLAMVVDVLPVQSEAAKDMGVWHCALARAPAAPRDSGERRDARLAPGELRRRDGVWGRVLPRRGLLPVWDGSRPKDSRDQVKLRGRL